MNASHRSHSHINRVALIATRARKSTSEARAGRESLKRDAACLFTTPSRDDSRPSNWRVPEDEKGQPPGITAVGGGKGGLLLQLTLVRGAVSFGLDLLNPLALVIRAETRREHELTID